MYICIGKNTVCIGFGTYLCFQASTGGLVIYTLWMGGLLYSPGPTTVFINCLHGGIHLRFRML